MEPLEKKKQIEQLQQLPWWMRLILYYTPDAIRFRWAKRKALKYHYQDRKQYHVVYDDKKYKLMNEESRLLHNIEAKKSNHFKHITGADMLKMSLFMTPYRSKLQL